MHANGRRTLAAALVATSLLAGCQTTGGEKESLGTVIGAVGGALIGSQIGSGSGRVAAVIAGGVIGAGIGNRIGQYLDERDRQLQAEATADALSTDGQNSQRWVNPDGNSGAVNAEPAEPSDDAQYVECRNVKQTLDAHQNVSDTLRYCRQADGRWTKVA